MITFDPPEFRAELERALNAIEQALRVDADYLGDDLVDPRRSDWDPNDYDDLSIASNTELQLWLPNSDRSICSSYAELLALAEELKGAELVGGVEGWTSRRLVLRVVPVFAGDSDIPLEQWLEAAEPDGALLLKADVDGVEFACSFLQGSTLFGLLVVAFGYYDKSFPPTSSEEYFVQVLAEGRVERSAIRAVANAYIFELASSLRLDCRLNPRPGLNDLFVASDGPYATVTVPSLRPLLVGPGVDGAIATYNSAIAAADPSFQLLGFVKVIEHVAQTVIRTQITDAVRAKLSSPRALNPDANFVLELESLVADHRAQRKDRESLRATVNTCCDVSELARSAPDYLLRLKAIGPESDEREKRAALDELAGALTATRNSVAHSKAGYTPSGEECPTDQLPVLASCARQAAEQSLRWYAARHESIRVV